MWSASSSTVISSCVRRRCKARRVLIRSVRKSAGSRHYDVGAAHLVDLPADRHAAVDSRNAHADGLTQGCQYVGDLLGEFASGHQDEGPGCLLLPRLGAGGQPGQQRETERQGFAGSGLGPAEDVTARQGVGYGPGLDGERFHDATGSQRGDQTRVHAELGEAGRGWCRDSGGGGKGRIERGAWIAPLFLAAPLRTALD